MGPWLAAVVALHGVAGCHPEARETPTQGQLEVAVSEAHAPPLARQAELFNSLYTRAAVTVRPVSTRRAFAAVVVGSAALVVVDRSPDAQEEAALASLELERVDIGEDALAFLVNKANDLESVSTQQVGDLLAGRTRDWSALPAAGLSGPITVVLTDRESGAWQLLATRFFPGLDVPQPTRIEATQGEVLRTVATSPGALGVVSVAAWRARAAGIQAAAATGEPGWANGVAPAAAGSVRCLAIADLDASGHPVVHALHQANVHGGLYPFHYPITVLFNKRSSLAAGFSAFLASAPGQKQVLDAGLVPATMPVRLVHLK